MSGAAHVTKCMEGYHFLLSGTNLVTRCMEGKSSIPLAGTDLVTSCMEGMTSIPLVAMNATNSYQVKGVDIGLLALSDSDCRILLEQDLASISILTDSTMSSKGVSRTKWWTTKRQAMQGNIP